MRLRINKKYLFTIFCGVFFISIFPNIIFANTPEFTGVSATTVNFSNGLISLGQSLYLTVIEFSILNFSKIVSYPIVKDLWQLFRDLINIVIIVLFIWTAFTTVIERAFDFQKKMLFWLIIASILNNFSAFFVSALVDVANAIVLVIVNLSLNSTFNFAGDLTEEVRKALTLEGSFLQFFVAILHLSFGILYSITYLVLSFFLLSRFVSAIFLIITSPFGLLGFLIKSSISNEKNNLTKLLNNWHEKWLGTLNSIFLIPIIGIFTLYISTEISRALIKSFSETAVSEDWGGLWIVMLPVLSAGIVFFIINLKAWKVMFSEDRVQPYAKKALKNTLPIGKSALRGTLRGVRGAYRSRGRAKEFINNPRETFKNIVEEQVAYKKDDFKTSKENTVASYNAFLDKGKDPNKIERREKVLKGIQGKREKERIERERIENESPEEFEKRRNVERKEEYDKKLKEYDENIQKKINKIKKEK